MNYLVIVNISLIFVLALFIGSTLPSKWNFVKKYLISLVIIFSLNNIIGVFLSPLNIKINSGIFSYIYIILILALNYKVFVLDKRRFLDLFNWEAKDTAIILSVVTLFVFLIYPSLSKSSTKPIHIVVPIGGDFSTHFSLANLITQNGKYLYYNAEAGKDKAPFGATDYPQAAHFNFAVILGNNNDNDVTSTLNYFRYFYIFCYLILFAIFLDLSLSILSSKVKNGYTYIAMASSAFFIFASNFVSFSYIDGFISQIISLAVLLALALCTFEESKFKNKKMWLVLLILLNALIAGTWYFITPIALASSFLGIYRSKYGKNVLAYLSLLPAVAIPISASVISSVRFGSINSSGAILNIPIEYFIIFTLATIATLWQYQSLRVNSVYKWTELLLITILFCIVIGSYQLITSRQVSYYFLKALYTPVLIASLFYGAFITLAINKAQLHFNKIPKAIYTTIALIIYISSIFALVYQPVTRDASINIALRDKYINRQVMLNITQIAENARARNKSTVLINTGSSLNDYVYAKWISALNLNFSKEYADLLLYNLNLADKFRRAGKSENLQAQDIYLPNNSIEIVDFNTGRVIE